MALFLGLMTSRTGSHDVTNNRDLPTPEYLEGVDDTSFDNATRLEHSPYGYFVVCVATGARTWRNNLQEAPCQKKADHYSDFF